MRYCYSSIRSTCCRIIILNVYWNSSGSYIMPINRCILIEIYQSRRQQLIPGSSSGITWIFHWILLSPRRQSIFHNWDFEKSIMNFLIEQYTRYTFQNFFIVRIIFGNKQQKAFRHDKVYLHFSFCAIAMITFLQFRE